MGYREVAMDSGYISEPDDYEDEEPEPSAEPRDLTCEICSDSLTRCPHGRSDYDPAAEIGAEFDRLRSGEQATPSPMMERLLRAILGELTPEERAELYR